MSPDGTRIAFVRTDIWLLSLDSLVIRSLSTTGDFPSWHPNGDEVVVLKRSVVVDVCRRFVQKTAYFLLT